MFRNKDRITTVILPFGHEIPKKGIESPSKPLFLLLSTDG
jgi:hypothetical protein